MFHHEMVVWYPGQSFFLWPSVRWPHFLQVGGLRPLGAAAAAAAASSWACFSWVAITSCSSATEKNMQNITLSWQQVTCIYGRYTVLINNNIDHFFSYQYKRSINILISEIEVCVKNPLSKILFSFLDCLGISLTQKSSVNNS